MPLRFPSQSGKAASLCPFTAAGLRWPLVMFLSRLTRESQESNGWNPCIALPLLLPYNLPFSLPFLHIFQSPSLCAIEPFCFFDDFGREEEKAVRFSQPASGGYRIPPPSVAFILTSLLNSETQKAGWSL